jgi:hypothetical protein
MRSGRYGSLGQVRAVNPVGEVRRKSAWLLHYHPFGLGNLTSQQRSDGHGG